MLAERYGAKGPGGRARGDHAWGGEVGRKRKEGGSQLSGGAGGRGGGQRGGHASEGEVGGGM